ncbi:MAG: hypothetical protein WC523_04850 [Patescibacteria group bacterium]
MSFFDQAYDAMTWQEVCYRLPSELAISALKRRVTNLDTLKMFFDNVGTQPANIKQLKEHVNSVLSSEKIDDVFNNFDSTYHPTLFNWMTKENSDRFKAVDLSKLGLKFLFNLTDSKDQAGLDAIMDKVLSEDINSAHIRSVLSKADDKCVAPLLNKLSVDVRPEVRACLLCVPGSNSDKVSELQKIIGLKALAKCTSSPLNAVNMLGLGVFSSLRPAERMVALERYLDCFPNYHKMPAFIPAPSEEELRIILFAGCLTENESTNKIMEKYKLITEADQPKDEEEE